MFSQLEVIILPSHHEKKHSRHSPEKLFGLVADIEKYPEFLPWCSAARIREKGDDYVIADLVITFAAYSEKYTSKVTLSPPDAAAQKNGSIDVELVEGPFSRLTNSWKFIYAEDGGTDIEFAIEFKFRSVILEKLIGFVFEKALVKMVGAFEKRADELFGN